MDLLSELKFKRDLLRIRSRKQDLGANDFAELFGTAADAVAYQLAHLGIPAADILKRPAASFAIGYARGLTWHLALTFVKKVRKETLNPDNVKSFTSSASKLFGEVVRFLLGTPPQLGGELSETQTRGMFNFGVELGLQDGVALEPYMMGAVTRLPRRGTSGGPAFHLLEDFRRVEVALAAGWFSTETEADGKRPTPFLARPDWPENADTQAIIRAQKDPQFKRQAELAVNGDTDSQYQIGVRLVYGIELPKDCAVAASYLEPAASKGHADAQFLLGTLYEEGLGVERDLAKAKVLYEQAVSGNKIFRSSAHVRLGRMFEQGRGTAVDCDKARACYDAAGDDNRAWLYLGDMYRDGRGVPQDDVEAVRLYRCAAIGDGQANVNLGRMYLEGRGVARDIDEAYRLFCKVVDSPMHRWDDARAEAMRLRDVAKSALSEN